MLICTTASLQGVCCRRRPFKYVWFGQAFIRACPGVPDQLSFSPFLPSPSGQSPQHKGRRDCCMRATRNTELDRSFSRSRSGMYQTAADQARGTRMGAQSFWSPLETHLETRQILYLLSLVIAATATVRRWWIGRGIWLIYCKDPIFPVHCVCSFSITGRELQTALHRTIPQVSLLFSHKYASFHACFSSSSTVSKDKI
jgi:hypothetical protein